MQIFATLDAQGAPFELPNGAPFTSWRLKVADEPEAALYGVAVGDYAVVQLDHTPAPLDSYADDMLARYDIQRVIIAEPSEGQVLAGYTLAVDGAGVITASATYEAAPPPPRREIPKSTVTDRLDVIGKLGTVFTALQSNPRAFGRWFAPDWPNVYADDAELLALLNGVGCTADEIAQVTAP